MLAGRPSDGSLTVSMVKFMLQTGEGVTMPRRKLEYIEQGLCQKGLHPWVDENIGTRHPKGRNPYQFCKVCKSINGKRYYASDPQRWLDYQMDYQIRRRFGLDGGLDAYQNMLQEQGGGCGICGKTEEEEGKRLAVDHDHSCCPGRTSCGECVRGLLCYDCNINTLPVIEKTELVSAAQSYLKKHRSESGSTQVSLV